MKHLGLTLLALTLPSFALAQESDTPTETPEYSQDVYELASKIYLLEKAKEAAAEAETASEETGDDAPMTFEEFENWNPFGNVDWTSLVLIDDAKKRLKARHALTKAWETENHADMLAARARLVELEDPHRHWADFLIHFGATGQPKDEAKGAQAALAAAEAGMRDAYLTVAELYKDGAGLEQSDRKAALWVLRAVAVNQKDASTAAFPFARDGIGMTADPELAMALAEHRDNWGDAEMQLYIAKSVMESDPDRARQQLQRAAVSYRTEFAEEAKAILAEKGWPLED